MERQFIHFNEAYDHAIVYGASIKEYFLKRLAPNDLSFMSPVTGLENWIIVEAKTDTHNWVPLVYIEKCC